MAEYVPLQKLFYQDTSTDRDAAILLEAKKRLHEESSFRTGIWIDSGELFLAMPKQLTLLSERLFRVERKVSRLWRELPGIARWAYLRGLIMDEIVSTNEIEGIHSTRRQIEEALESTESNNTSAQSKRFREFAQLYLELTNTDHVYPKKPENIREIYDAVVAGELAKGDQPDGELFRKEQVSIVSSDQKVIHRGVMPEARITDMLRQMISLVNSSEIPSTYSAIIAHFLFEYIHPFYDGNGRTGRYLLALYLSEPLSLPTVLSLSAVIAENKSKYYEAFKTTESTINHAEATFFVLQMMQFIRNAQDSVMENLTIKKSQLDNAEHSLDALQSKPYSLTEKEIHVVFQAAQSYLFGAFSEVSLREIAQGSHVGAQTARKYSRKLEEKELIKVVSKKPLKFELTMQAFELLGIAEE